MYKLVSVSRNTSLLLSRNDALGMAGFTVISPRTPAEAPALALQRGADAVILGDSIPPEERATLIAELRRVCHKCLIVVVYAVKGLEQDPSADLNVDVSLGPETLIKALGERLPRAEGSVA